MFYSDKAHRPEAPRRREILGGAAALAALGIAAGFLSPPVRRALAASVRGQSAFEALTLSDQWLNSIPLGPQTLQGKVVVVAFWTYSCINSLRVLPYLRAWQAKYDDLVVVGVHTPEFEFERARANVEQALEQLDVQFPVVMDSDYKIWRAFGNNAWPAFYFIDAAGQVHGQAIGEGGYDTSEERIQKLLMNRGGPVPAGISTVAGVGPEAAPDFEHLQTGETYMGYRQASGFVSPGGLRHDRSEHYRPTPALQTNRWTLNGEWTAGEEFATLDDAGGIATFRFHARDLHMVLAPSELGRPVRFRVRLDGAAPGADHGWDVQPDGSGVVLDPRMYQLARQAGPVRDRTFEIEFLDPGVRAYVFTFG